MSAATSEVQVILERGGPLLDQRMRRAESRLQAVTRSTRPPLGPHVVDTIAAGGKRLRPLLVMLAAPAPSPTLDEAALERAAVAVELVHSATLVHDDVLDAADLRRGRPTVVARAGRATAVAAGDLLFSRAFAELARNASVAQLQALSQASSALALGELLQREDAYSPTVTVERYLRRCELKTARLFEAACLLGVLAGGPVGVDADALGAYGRGIGLAFQLLDDVLDVSGPAVRTGKHRGTDLLDGTVTLPLIIARQRDRSLATRDLRDLGGASEAQALCDEIAATGALEESRRHALEIVGAAKAGLPAAMAADQRELLELVADAVVDRYS